MDAVYEDYMSHCIKVVVLDCICAFPEYLATLVRLINMNCIQGMGVEPRN